MRETNEKGNEEEKFKRKHEHLHTSLSCQWNQNDILMGCLVADAQRQGMAGYQFVGHFIFRQTFCH